MKRFLFIVVTLILGLLIHLISSRYLSYHGIGPQILFLFILSYGFLCGPLLGATMGFFWGMMSDSIGVSFFGLQGFLFALTGYVAGKLRKRVASERPTAQIAIALVATVFYSLGVGALKSSVGQTAFEISLWTVFFELILNALLIPVVFLGTEIWIQMWGIESEHI